MDRNFGKVGIVVPCYNEGERLCVAEFERLLQDSNFQVLFVNDGSTDDTVAILKKLGIEGQGFISLKENSGKAEAIRQGVNFLLKNVENLSYVGYLDADLATPISELDRFYEELSKNTMDMILGSRIQRLGANIHRHPLRHYLGRIFATFASLTLKLPIYDTQCGAKFMRSSIANQVFKNKFNVKWMFDVELIMRVKQARGENSFFELPLLNWRDVGGSKLKLVDFFKAPLELFRIHRIYNGF